MQEYNNVRMLLILFYCMVYMNCKSLQIDRLKSIAFVYDYHFENKDALLLLWQICRQLYVVIYLEMENLQHMYMSKLHTILIVTN